jgi:hypothetical protein
LRQSPTESASCSQSPSESQIDGLRQNSDGLSAGSVAAIVVVVVIVILVSAILVVFFLRPCQSPEFGDSSESGDAGDKIRFVEDLGGKEKALVLDPSLKDIFYMDEQPDFIKFGPDADPFKAFVLK